MSKFQPRILKINSKLDALLASPHFAAPRRGLQCQAKTSRNRQCSRMAKVLYLETDILTVAYCVVHAYNEGVYRDMWKSHDWDFNEFSSRITSEDGQPMPDIRR